MLPKSDDCNHTIFKTPFQNIIFVDHYYNVVQFAPMKQRSTNWTCHTMPLHDTYCNAVSVSHCFVLKLYFSSIRTAAHACVHHIDCFSLASRINASIEAQLSIARRAAETHFVCIASLHGERCGNHGCVNSKPSKTQHSLLIQNQSRYISTQIVHFLNHRQGNEIHSASTCWHVMSSLFAG